MSKAKLKSGKRSAKGPSAGRVYPPLDPKAGWPRRAKGTRGKFHTTYPELDVSALAALTDVTPYHLCKVMRGTTRPSMALASKLAGLCGWTLDQMAGIYQGKA